MWRYRELMPLFDGEAPVTLGEGLTPLIHARALGATLGLDAAVHQGRVAQPDQLVQGARPVGRDHARARASARRRSRCRRPATPATRWRPTRRAPGSQAKVFMPQRRQARRSSASAELYGADVTLVDGLITDAGRIAAERGGPLGWYDVSTLKEPYRIEGKKTMAYELAEQMDWTLPDWIIYPTGGGTGMVGMWKAFEEMERIGWMPPRTPAADGVGAGRGLRADRPRVRAGRRAGRSRGRTPRTVADGLRVPQRDRRLPDPARRSRERRHGARRQRRSTMVDGMRRDRPAAKASAPRPKAAPRCSAATARRRRVRSAPDESVVLFNTGGALKYLEYCADEWLSRGPWCRDPSTVASARLSRRTRRRSRGRLQQVVVERHGLRPADDFAERHGHDVGRMVRHHLPELARDAAAPPPCRRTASPACDRTPSARRRAAGGRARRSASPCRSARSSCVATALRRRRRAARRSRRAPPRAATALPSFGCAPSATTTMLKRAPHVVALADALRRPSRGRRESPGSG